MCGLAFIRENGISRVPGHRPGIFSNAAILPAIAAGTGTAQQKGRTLRRQSARPFSPEYRKDHVHYRHRALPA
jgi:hypothetical protein